MQYIASEEHKRNNMIAHYLKVAVRNLLKYKTQSVISIVGLAIGLAFFVFGLHWYRFETTFDSFYPLADRTYMVCLDSKNNDMGYTPSVLKSYFDQECPEVEMSTVGYCNTSIAYDGGEGIFLKEPNFLYVDSCFIRMFPQRILYGRTIENEQETIICESLARKYWGEPQNAVGYEIKQDSPYKPLIRLPNPKTMRIVGVMADAPNNSNFTFEGYIQDSRSLKKDIHNSRNWSFASGWVHATLNKGVKPKDVLEKISRFLQEKEIQITNPRFISLADKHFEMASKDSFSYSAIALYAVASFLLLCCVMFNYLNLSLNRYFGRVREMKLRTVVGATIWKMQLQFMVEALISCLFAFLLCGCMLELLIPVFKDLFLIPMESNRDIWTEYVYTIVGTLLFIEVVAALVMHHFIRNATRQTLVVKPITSRYAGIRRISLAVQLVICLLFICMAAVFFRQLNFMRNSDYGFDTEHIIEMDAMNIDSRYDAMIEDLSRLPMVEYHTGTQDEMIDNQSLHTQPGVEWEGQNEEDKNILVHHLYVNKNIDKVFNFRLVAGRMFSEEDWDNVENGNAAKFAIINEKMANLLSTNSPIGSTISITNVAITQQELEITQTPYQIIGVVKDCHFQGMKNEVFPMLMIQSPAASVDYWRIVPGMEQEALKAFNEVAAKHGWEYNQSNTPPVLLSDKVKEINKSETAIYRLFSCLAVVCILISLFGIYSISFTTLELRRKEIAIRKVHGAQVLEIMNLFFREYIGLLLLAAIIAFPVAYWGITRWLQGYAYHIEVGLALFVTILVAILALILLTVVQQVHKAANENPAEVVKSE